MPPSSSPSALRQAPRNPALLAEVAAADADAERGVLGSGPLNARIANPGVTETDVLLVTN